MVNAKQAVIIRRIYSLFLQGKTPHGIAKILTENNIPTPSSKKNWSPTVIKSILTNEKYKGDALLQKSFTVDFLTKKTKTNEGKIPQYYVEGNHEAIIDPEILKWCSVRWLAGVQERTGIAESTSFLTRLNAETVEVGTAPSSGIPTMPTSEQSGNAIRNTKTKFAAKHHILMKRISKPYS